MISVLILTKNEEQDLPTCLASVAWCDDVHVFDSYSSDKTVQIAQNTGARVTQRAFDGYASQRNAALNNLNFRYNWILIVDSDEVIPKELVPKLYKNIQSASADVNGFRIRRRDYLNNTWLKHAQISPFYIRLIRRGKAQYHREINEILEVHGIVKNIDGYFKHYPFSKGIAHWINKHNLYSTMEAKRHFEEHNHNYNFSLKEALFNKDFNQKRYHQKGIFYKLPGRPIIKLVYMIFWRRSFLDGWAGITYSLLQTIYEYFIVLKSKEYKANLLIINNKT